MNTPYIISVIITAQESHRAIYSYHAIHRIIKDYQLLLLYADITLNIYWYWKEAIFNSLMFFVLNILSV